MPFSPATDLNCAVGKQQALAKYSEFEQSVDVHRQTRIRTAVEHATVKVLEEDSLGRLLEQSELFPPITVHLIASRETSGQLDRMLENSADTQEREIQTQTSMLVGIFEPMLILLMGGIVLIIVISILLPIFEMNQPVR